MGSASAGGFQELNIICRWENGQFNNSNNFLLMCVRAVSSYELLMGYIVLSTVTVRMYRIQ